MKSRIYVLSVLSAFSLFIGMHASAAGPGVPVPPPPPPPSGASNCTAAVCVDDTYRPIGSFALSGTLKSGSGSDTAWNVSSGHLLGKGVALVSGDVAVVRNSSNPLSATVTVRKVGTFQFSVTSSGTTDTFLVRTYDPAADSTARCADGGNCFSGTRHNYLRHQRYGGAHAIYQNGQWVECDYACQKDRMKKRLPGGHSTINGMGVVWHDNFRLGYNEYGVPNTISPPAPEWGSGLSTSVCESQHDSWDGYGSSIDSGEQANINACEPDFWWETLYHSHGENSGIEIGGSGPFVVENMMLSGGDAIEFSGSPSGYTVRDVYIPFAGDDAIEADEGSATGTIDDVLIDSCLQGPAFEGSGTITLKNTIIRKTQRFGIYKGKAVPGQGGFFKFDNPTNAENNIFVTGKVKGFPENTSGEELSLSFMSMTNSYNNIIVYLGTDSDADVWKALRLPVGGGGRFILTRDPSIYLEARDNWFARHPDIRYTGLTP